MIKTTYFFIIILLPALLFSQTDNTFKSGIVTYEIQVLGNETLDSISNIKEKKMLKGIQQILNSKTFTLEFNKNEAQFKSIKTMPNENQKDDPILKIAEILAKESKVYYANNNEKIKLEQTKVGGNNFLIQEVFGNDNWIIEKDTKTILGYECRRAHKKITEYNSVTQETRVFFPEVWFTPNINYPFGPIGLDGLPGLVLEATINNKMVYTAKSINLNNPEINLTILKGRKISKVQFQDLLNENSSIHN